jgi:hypothetical protein
MPRPEAENKWAGSAPGPATPESIQAHIKYIRNRLWTGREFGKAAVMVGSGFSRNAQRLVPTAPQFPLWRDLEDMLATRLGRADQELRGPLSATPSAGPVTPDAVRLATEYEDKFGRAALDDLLREAIPDSSYAPGRLHRLLLSLPWSDVFSTNYDTLIERASARTHFRKYDRVFTKDDIPNCARPRIVKLHGSFPSHRPFVITERDYRDYDRAFVNTVLQSLMENVFCLVGFSGTDPNFVYWTRWVAERLGNSAPLIYLCGILDLTEAQRKELENKRVVPIDLSSIFPLERSNGTTRLFSSSFLCASVKSRMPQR